MAATRNNMRRTRTGDLGGFTIIEVVLVLAIAGLIFLMVFIALPSLQRAQRDTQRRTDLGRVQDQIVQYQTNNKGKLPTATGAGTKLNPLDGDLSLPTCGSNTPAACFIRNYMNSVHASENEFVDPDGWSYGISFETLGNGEERVQNEFDHMIYVYEHARCDGEKAIYSNGSRDFAIVYRLEGNGTYCSQNS